MNWIKWLPGYKFGHAAGRRSVMNELERLEGPVLLALNHQQVKSALDSIPNGGTVVVLGPITFPAGKPMIMGAGADKTTIRTLK